MFLLMDKAQRHKATRPHSYELTEDKENIATKPQGHIATRPQGYKAKKLEGPKRKPSRIKVRVARRDVRST